MAFTNKLVIANNSNKASVHQNISDINLKMLDESLEEATSRVFVKNHIFSSCTDLKMLCNNFSYTWGFKCSRFGFALQCNGVLLVTKSETKETNVLDNISILSGAIVNGRSIFLYR